MYIMSCLRNDLLLNAPKKWSWKKFVLNCSVLLGTETHYFSNSYIYLRYCSTIQSQYSVIEICKKTCISDDITWQMQSKIKLTAPASFWALITIFSPPCKLSCNVLFFSRLVPVTWYYRSPCMHASVFGSDWLVDVQLDTWPNQPACWWQWLLHSARPLSPLLHC